MKAFKYLLWVFFLSIFIQFSFASEEPIKEEYYKGKILEVLAKDESGKQDLKVILDTGEELIVINDPNETAKTIDYKEGLRVVIQKFSLSDGSDRYLITDFDRVPYLLGIFAVFVVLALLVGKMHGFNSLIGMGFSFFVIFKYILPQIISGKNPIFVTIIASIFIIPVTFYLSHGFNKKTHTAIFSTLLTLIFTSILTSFAVYITNLTGYSSDEALFLQIAFSEIDMRGILLAGIIIGFLGVLDDVTVSQASIVSQLSKAKEYKNFMDLYFDAMEVGRDHITSMINTLVLVYAGASMPLLLLFINNPQPLSIVLNTELIADEIVRTLLGSIGLIMAVPLSTLVAAIYADVSNK